MPSEVRPAAKQLEFLRRQPPLLGLIGSVGRDGTPHVVPLWYLYDEAANRFMVTTPFTAAKVKNVRRNGRASLVVFDGPKYLFVRGSARVDEASGESVTRRLAVRYMGEEEGKKASERINNVKHVTIVITPERILDRQLEN